MARQYTGQGPQLGPTLIAEALNLLFEKYGVESGHLTAVPA